MSETTPSIPGAELTPQDETDLADALSKCESALKWYDFAVKSTKYAGLNATLPDFQKARRELMGAIVRLEPIVKGQA